MKLFRNMKLGTRFTIIMLLIFSALVACNAVDDYYRQHALIRQDAIDSSRMMARQIIETRSYLSSVMTDEPARNQNLVPQVASTRIAAAISKDTQYTLRQTSLRYRNPENKPDPYEAAVLGKFNKSRITEHFEVIDSSGEETFRYMVPMIADPSCLECHGSYESAPEFVRKRFPKGHFSYNYKVGEVIGAISISIPMKELHAKIGRNLKSNLLFSGFVVFLILLLTETLIRRFIIAPVTKLSETLCTVARTGAFGTKLPVDGTDEISRLIITYNAMIEELERKSIQRQESDERYRNMIDMARSAIITFIRSGRIVIANRSAERLLGTSRDELIGTVFYECLVNGDSLQNELEKSLADDRPWEGSTFSMQLRNIRGVVQDVELAISATISDGHPIFTAIIREIGKD
jgi:PAS domain S-box-containing protein